MGVHIKQQLIYRISFMLPTHLILAALDNPPSHFYQTVIAQISMHTLPVIMIWVYNAQHKTSGHHHPHVHFNKSENHPLIIVLHFIAAEFLLFSIQSVSQQLICKKS